MMDFVNARTVVLLTFDFDAESAQVRKTPQLPVTLSKGQFARVGVERILGLLDKYRIHSTFFTPAWTARQYSGVVHEIARRGHEIAAHGYLHENLSELDENEERGVHEKSVNMLEEAAGKKPIGFRAPYWEWSARTLGFLRKYQFAYDSSLMSDDKPYLIDGGSSAAIYELPVEWFLDDWTLFEEHRQSPSMVLEAWRSEFDAVHDLGVGYFMLTMHPECVGRASRINMLEQLVNHMRARKGIVFARCDELVEHLRRSSGHV
jgi:peptidoglycan/xylan/chitin deacetylase (PgdA/CDA1 family)